MNRKHYFFMVVVTLLPIFLQAQQPARQEPIDTSFTDYDLLFSDMEKFLDSITAPRSFTMFNVSVVNNYFDYDAKSSEVLKSVRKLMYMPSLSYFGKSGFGISISAAAINDSNRLNTFQASLTGSYDYIRNSHFMTGIAFSRFMTKSDLPFYTSPLNNNIYAYFTYKKCWVKPSVAVSYGWGSRTSYSEREDLITSLLLAKNGYARINKQESVTDFNLIASLRHDFYWLHVLSAKDYFRLTPQIVFTGGSQKFGFNETSGNNASPLQKTNSDFLYQNDNIYLESKTSFQPLFISTRLKTEYALGKFYVQPQFLIDYYFPAATNNVSTGFVMSAGVIF